MSTHYVMIADMESMGERLRKARKEAGFSSARSAAMKLGWSPSTYGAHENGQNDFDAEVALIYAKAFKVRAGWLLTGEGDAKRSGVESSVDADIRPGLQDGSIPELDVRAGAGGGGLPVEAWVRDAAGNTYSAEGIRDFWTLPPAILREQLHSDARHIRAFEVIGDSMEPRLGEGDRVFVDLRYTLPSPEGIFALWDGYGVVIKRVQIVRDSDPLRVRIISVNPSYEPYEAAVEDIRIIGRYAGRFTTN